MNFPFAHCVQKSWAPPAGQGASGLLIEWSHVISKTSAFPAVRKSKPTVLLNSPFYIFSLMHLFLLVQNFIPAVIWISFISSLFIHASTNTYIARPMLLKNYLSLRKHDFLQRCIPVSDTTIWWFMLSTVSHIFCKFYFPKWSCECSFKYISTSSRNKIQREFCFPKERDWEREMWCDCLNILKCDAVLSCTCTSLSG